nr:MAG TPA: hypothetical protein [Crassvirales sp.]
MRIYTSKVAILRPTALASLASARCHPSCQTQLIIIFANKHNW